jgi:hypothetical protein
MEFCIPDMLTISYLMKQKFGEGNVVKWQFLSAGN